jgi:uncharacterized membrane protein YkvI
VWIAVFAVIITVAWFTQSSGWVQLIAFLFPVLAVLWIANWTRQWRENDAVRKGKRPPS